MNLKKYSFFTLGAIAVSLLTGVMALESATAIKKVPTSHKVIAFTFDDGPYPGTTTALLTVLKTKQARATFFVLGSQVEQYPSLAAEIVNSGQEIASHSYWHRFPNKLPLEEFYNDLAKAEAAISAVGPKPTLFRPPGGGYNDNLVAELKQRGYNTILWSIDTRDWSGISSNRIVDSVLSKAEPGAIVLLHEGACAVSTPEAVGVIIDRLREKGYEFVTISELLQYYEIR